MMRVVALGHEQALGPRVGDELGDVVAPRFAGEPDEADRIGEQPDHADDRQDRQQQDCQPAGVLRRQE